MTLFGAGAQKLSQKKRDAQIAKSFPKGIKCQKCLQLGHWSYECKGKRKYVHRTSRTKHLNKKIEEMKESETSKKTKGEPKTKKQKADSSSSDSSSDSSSSSSSSDSDSDSSDSSSSSSGSSSSSSSSSSD